MSERTPGKWEVIGKHSYTVWAGDTIIATSALPRGSKEAKANARMMAAAPELLEALKSAIKTAEFERHPFRAWHTIAKEAIAKAEGKL